MWKNYFLKKLINIMLKSNADFDALMRSIEESDSGYSKLITHITKNSDVLMKIGDRILESETIFSMFARYISNKGSDEKCQYKVSYAQSGEDLIIDFVFKTVGINKPSYIDIGAYDPYKFSNTAFFYLNGSRGINIEPNPKQYERFVRYRGEDTNLNIGISDRAGELDYYFMDSPTLNTFSQTEAERYEREEGHKIIDTKKIKVDTIESVVNSYCNKLFPDLLTIDAEGRDKMILQSIDYNNNFPSIICLETLSYSQKGKEMKDRELIDYLIDKGYFLYADTYINSIFVREEIWRPQP